MMPAPHPEPQHSTSRSDAIAAGVLIEVPPRLARLFRLPHPLAVTAPAWFDAVLWDAAAEASKPTPSGQSETVRITDLLSAASAALKSNALPGAPAGTVVSFPLHRVPPTGPELASLRVCLTLTVSTGDCGELVATIDHQQHPVVGEFRVPDLDRSWRAVNVEFSPGYVWPVVAADTLDAIVSALAAVDPSITAATAGDRVVHIYRSHGPTTQFWPDRVDHYILRGLPGITFDWFHR